MPVQSLQSHLGKIVAFGCGAALFAAVFLFGGFNKDPAADRLVDAEASVAVGNALDPPFKSDLPHAQQVEIYANEGDKAKARGAAKIEAMGGYCPQPWRFRLKGDKVGIMTCGNGRRYLLTNNQPPEPL
jgi:hypothetical protein